MKPSPILLLILATAQWIDGKFLGCYEDSRVRLLPDFSTRLYDVNNPARCLHLCQKLQYQYAGLEYGHECYCGSDRPYELMKRDISDCNIMCPNSEEMCGGGWKIAIYSADSHIYPTTDDGTYIGCYLENDTARTLDNFRLYHWNSLSPKRCIHTCTTLGYMYAGLEPENLCFCGNTNPANDRKTKESECNDLCPNSQETCGGKERIAIYRTTFNSNNESVVSVSDERLRKNAVGCFEDSNPHILSEFSTSFPDINSPKNCLYLCQQLDYPYAGVQNGVDCYCGNQMPSPSRKRNDNDCQASCPNSSEMCGGEDRIYVYSTQKFPNQLHSDTLTLPLAVPQITHANDKDKDNEEDHKRLTEPLHSIKNNANSSSELKTWDPSFMKKQEQTAPKKVNKCTDCHSVLGILQLWKYVTKAD